MGNVTKVTYLALNRQLPTDFIFSQQLCKNILFLLLKSKVGVTDLFFPKKKNDILTFKN